MTHIAPMGFGIKTVNLFVYGIFLNQSNRDDYFMVNPRYATVKGFVTKGQHIVTAVPSNDPHVALTGLIVDILDDETNWRWLDSLETGYDRILIKTTSGEVAYMYAARGTGNRVTEEEIQ
jgi:hypothetical protein